MPPPGQTQRATSKYIVFENFEKMNTQSVRQALSEKELAWLENLQPIAPNNLTTVPGPSPALTSISGTIVSEYFASINSVDYIMSFTSDGSLWATNIASAVSSRIAGPSAFTDPDLTTWQSNYVLINDPTSSYSAWNGTIFVKQGGVSPVITVTNAGTGYTSVPTVSITGGSGTGATAVATIQTPSVNAVNVVNGGTGYSATPPTVVFSGGGGTGAAATAHADPQGLTSVTITNAGEWDSPDSGAAPILSASVSGGGGSGATLQAIQGKSSDNGTFSFWQVAALNILTAGSNYTSAPTISFSISFPGGGGIIHN